MEQIRYGFYIIFLPAFITAVIIAGFGNKQVDDIQSVYTEGQAILQRQNPYQRIEASDMKTNDKYATYLPGIYYLSAGMQLAGADTLTSWLVIWRILSGAAYLAIGYLLYRLTSLLLEPVLAIGAAALWYFNSFTVNALSIAHTDFIALLPFVLSLLLLSRRPMTAYLLIGLSLALKHLAVLAVPLLFIDLYHQKKTVAAFWRAAGLIFAVPLIVSAPFLLWDSSSFLQSLLFSLTRAGDSHAYLFTINMLWADDGLLARVPLLLALAIVYWFFYAKKLPLYVAVCLSFVCFIALNPVLYNQYFVWPIALLPLALMQTKNHTIAE